MLESKADFLSISIGSCGIEAQLATIETLVPIPLNPFQTNGGTVIKQ